MYGFNHFIFFLKGLFCWCLHNNVSRCCGHDSDYSWWILIPPPSRAQVTAVLDLYSADHRCLPFSYLLQGGVGHVRHRTDFWVTAVTAAEELAFKLYTKSPLITMLCKGSSQVNFPKRCFLINKLFIRRWHYTKFTLTLTVIFHDTFYECKFKHPEYFVPKVCDKLNTTVKGLRSWRSHSSFAWNSTQRFSCWSFLYHSSRRTFSVVNGISKGEGYNFYTLRRCYTY